MQGKGTSLTVQWLRLQAFNAGSVGLISGWGPKVPHTTQHGQKKRKFTQSSTVTQVYVPRFFVLSQQRFGATDIKALGASQLSGLGQTVLQLLGKSVLQLHFI